MGEISSSVAQIGLKVHMSWLTNGQKSQFKNCEYNCRILVTWSALSIFRVLCLNLCLRTKINLHLVTYFVDLAKVKRTLEHQDCHSCNRVRAILATWRALIAWDCCTLTDAVFGTFCSIFRGFSNYIYWVLTMPIVLINIQSGSQPKICWASMKSNMAMKVRLIYKLHPAGPDTSCKASYMARIFTSTVSLLQTPSIEDSDRAWSFSCQNRDKDINQAITLLKYSAESTFLRPYRQHSTVRACILSDRSTACYAAVFLDSSY